MSGHHRYPKPRAVDARGKRYRVCLFCRYAYVATQRAFIAHAGLQVRRFGRVLTAQTHWHYCWRECRHAECIEARERWEERRRAVGT